MDVFEVGYLWFYGFLIDGVKRIVARQWCLKDHGVLLAVSIVPQGSLWTAAVKKELLRDD